MQKRLRLLIALFVFVLAIFPAVAQNVVSITTQIIPPYSPYLSTYVDQANKVNVILTNT